MLFLLSHAPFHVLMGLCQDRLFPLPQRVLARSVRLIIKLNLMVPLIMLYHIELFEYTLITILFTIYLTFGIGMAKFLGFQKIKLDYDAFLFL